MGIYRLAMLPSPACPIWSLPFQQGFYLRELNLHRDVTETSLSVIWLLFVVATDCQLTSIRHYKPSICRWRRFIYDGGSDAVLFQKSTHLFVLCFLLFVSLGKQKNVDFPVAPRHKSHGFIIEIQQRNIWETALIGPIFPFQALTVPKNTHQRRK